MSSASSSAPAILPLTPGESCGAHARFQPWPGGQRESVHGAIVPADVRAGDPVFAQLRVPGGPPRAARVWRLSPLGVELVRPGGLAGVGPGSTVELALRVGRGAATFTSLTVAGVNVEHGRELLALAWAPPPSPRPTARDTRGASRWACAGEYLPTGIAPNAARYGDFIYFRVADVSWTGMQLETSLRNTFLIPGLRLEATCTFPAQSRGQVQLPLEVVHARVVLRAQKRVLAVGVRFAAPLRDRARELLGQYLLQFGGGATVKDLCAAGFRIPASSLAFEFGYARTAEEYDEVLRLRRLAYVHARKISAEARAVDMADGFDARSRILVAKHRGRVVGTMRLYYPEAGADRLMHEGFVELPPGLPPRTELVELFKACTHPAYRGGDLFYALVRFAALTLVQSGRRYALMSATDALAPIYARVGFRRTGASYVHPGMGLRHHVMLADTRSVIEGKDINPVFWNLMDGYAIWSFARMGGAVGGGLRDAARVQLWRLFRPLAALVRGLYSFGSRRRRPPAQAPALRSASGFGPEPRPEKSGAASA
jgi:predicted GNAT family N-acyltransferase